jgi:hypothetical protein
MRASVDRKQMMKAEASTKIGSPRQKAAAST